MTKRRHLSAPPPRANKSNLIAAINNAGGFYEYTMQQCQQASSSSLADIHIRMDAICRNLFDAPLSDLYKILSDDSEQGLLQLPHKINELFESEKQRYILQTQIRGAGGLFNYAIQEIERTHLRFTDEMLFTKMDDFAQKLFGGKISPDIRKYLCSDGEYRMAYQHSEIKIAADAIYQQKLAGSAKPLAASGAACRP